VKERKEKRKIKINFERTGRKRNLPLTSSGQFQEKMLQINPL
jgi:hypothetical protein